MDKQIISNIQESADRWIGSGWWKNIKETEKQLENAYKSGAYAMYTELSSVVEWTNIKKECPDNNDIVLVKTDTNAVCIAYLPSEDSEFMIYGKDAFQNLGNITHWRKIDLNFKINLDN
jgi:hypothetical protein